VTTYERETAEFSRVANLSDGVELRNVAEPVEIYRAIGT
jgi:hypothetical protein